MARYNCVEKANTCMLLFSCPVFQRCCFCVSSNTGKLFHMLWLGGTYVLSSPLAWVIFLRLGFFPWCSLPACASLVLQECCGMATLNIIRLALLFLAHRRIWGKGQKGSWFLRLKQVTWIYSPSALRGSCFLPFSTLADFGKFGPFLTPQHFS